MNRTATRKIHAANMNYMLTHMQPECHTDKTLQERHIKRIKRTWRINRHAIEIKGCRSGQGQRAAIVLGNT